jgi:hypothetical protein
MEENQPQKVNSKSINTIKILICPVWAFEIILYLLYMLTLNLYKLSVHFGACYAYGLSMDIIIYCFIVL